MRLSWTHGERHSARHRGFWQPTIEILECLKSWFRTGIYTQQDLHAIVAAENAGMEEELELESGAEEN